MQGRSEAAMTMIRSGNAVDSDDIPVEIWRCLREWAVNFLTRLFNTILESESMEWGNGEVY